MFGIEVTNLRRSEDGTWLVSVEHVLDGKHDVMKFSRIVLCTGVSAFVSVESISQMALFDAGLQ
jgi:glycerol-3-phosphate dehydrogenase